MERAWKWHVNRWCGGHCWPPFCSCSYWCWQPTCSRMPYAMHLTRAHVPAEHRDNDPMTQPLLKLDNLTVRLGRGAGAIRPVDGVSLEIQRGETYSLLGESGCGK